MVSLDHNEWDLEKKSQNLNDELLIPFETDTHFAER